MNGVTMKSIEGLKPYALNAKKHDDKQVERIAESLRQFGWRQPIIVDADGVVVIGHGRLLAAKKLGWKEAWVESADDLTPEQIRKLRIIDNKTNESAWDFEKLAEDMQDIDLGEFDWGLIQDSNDLERITASNEAPVVTVQLTMTDEQAATVRRSIKQMRHTQTFKEYKNSDNNNNNGNALFLVVRQWLQQKTSA